MGNFLVWLSGARPELLARFTEERLRYQILGASVLCASLPAMLMFAVLSRVGGIPILLDFAASGAAVILSISIDRTLLRSVMSGRRRVLAWFVPRLLVGTLLGILLGPLPLLAILPGEVSQQVAVMRAEAQAEFLVNLERSPITLQVNHLQELIQSYQQVIATDGSARVNPAADPQLTALQAKLKQEQSQANYYYAQYACEVYGGQGCSGQLGVGPLAKDDLAQYQAYASQVASTQASIKAREQTLTAASASAAKARVAEARQNLPSAQAALKSDNAELAAQKQAFDQANSGTPGLLTQISALDRLSATAPTLNLARWLTSLLLIIIQLLPVIVTITAPLSVYEALETIQHVGARQTDVLDDATLARTIAGLRDDGVPSVPGADVNGSIGDDDVYDYALRALSSPAKSEGE